MHSDGNINKNQIRLRINKQDKEILELFNKSLNSNIEIKDEPNNIVNLTINSVKMVNDLKKYGIVENKTNTINFYNFNDKKLTDSYIRGIFDGDGWCYFSENSREIGFSGNLQTCTGLLQYLKETYNIPNLKITTVKSIYRIRICNKIGICLLYENIFKGHRDLSLKRKFDKIENFAVSKRAFKNRKTTL